MITLIALGVVTVLVIAAADVIAPRVRTAAPIVLVLVGIAASFIPGMPKIELEPDIILELILPPLLYGAAVAMPAMSFRRDLPAISWLAVPLVITSALVLGLLFAWLVPDLGFLWGMALGAIISPTDAVATSIIKGRGVPGRVVTILEGESLLNDASALVLLRTATVATVAGFSFWGALGSFAYSVAVAVLIGAIVGVGNFWVRKRISSPVVNTVLSFTLPFIASVPTELLGASGLVAAVVAGLITGFRGPRILPAQHRLTSGITWASIQLILEGFVFLTMGLQVTSVIEQLSGASVGIWPALGIAVLALVVTVLVRSIALVPQVWSISRRARRGQDMQPRIEAMQRRLEQGRQYASQHANDPEFQARAETFANLGKYKERMQRFETRLRRASAEIAFLVSQPIGAREGTVLVWAGMRGAVTVAAAQTLPPETPHRELLVFIAYAVATLSLLLQGGTIGAVVSRLFPAERVAESEVHEREERAAILSLLQAAAAGAEADLDPDAPEKVKRPAVLRAQRDTLLDARDDGLFDPEPLEGALAALDAEEIGLQLRGGPEG